MIQTLGQRQARKQAMEQARKRKREQLKRRKKTWGF
jgi:hypothetical protein